MGETRTLTTSTDLVEGTDGDDLIEAAAGTLNTTDVIEDYGVDDNDTMNVVTKGAIAAGATIVGIENINIDLQVIGNGSVALDNVSGATVTLSSEKLGFSGTAAVTGATSNTVVAGNGITTLVRKRGLTPKESKESKWYGIIL